jgi:FlaA1/EpsC-like NDP-sugar epimerase
MQHSRNDVLSRSHAPHLEQTNRWLSSLFCLPRRSKTQLQMLTDSLLLVFSFLMAMLLRLDSWDFLRDTHDMLVLRLGLYRAVVRFMTYKMGEALVIGVAASSLSLALVSYFFNVGVPRSVPFIYALLAIFAIGGVRMFLRAVYWSGQMRYKTRVAIYGAGAAGRQLAACLQQSSEHQPMAFVDDAVHLQHTSIHGLNVYAPHQIPELIENYGVQKILLAVPSASLGRRREILTSLERFDIPVQTVPGLTDVVSGRAKISEIRDVSEEDLLGRDPTPPNPLLMGAKIHDKVVMVTGAGGSIGSELSRQILRQKPRLLLLLELSEYALYSVEQELRQLCRQENCDVPIKALLGSVQHGRRMEAVMKTFGVQTIYHAAAYKHVPLVEHNMIEGIRNNVFGTLQTAEAAVAAGVETFVLVSTDKAVRPTNVMGATKRLAELVCQALAQTQSKTRFSMVRFGNVLGSSGSVVPLFRRQIQSGGPVTVTHPEITRYFMTVPEAAQLVIQAGSMAKGGDVFVLDMGAPVRIAELAEHMIRLSGLEPILPNRPKPAGGHKGDIEIVFTGLRPGEKLYEELLIGENVQRTSHPRIMTAHEVYLSWGQLQGLIEKLLAACRAHDHATIRQLLLEAPLAYQPQGEIVDLLCLKKAEKRESNKEIGKAENRGDATVFTLIPGRREAVVDQV